MQQLLVDKTRTKQQRRCLIGKKKSQNLTAPANYDDLLESLKSAAAEFV